MLHIWVTWCIRQRSKYTHKIHDVLFLFDFSWNSCRRAEDEQLPEIRPVLKQHFFWLHFFRLPRFLFLILMRCEDNFLTFVKWSWVSALNFLYFFPANSYSSLIKQTHLFPMPFILSTLIFVLLWFFPLSFAFISSFIIGFGMCYPFFSSFSFSFSHFVGRICFCMLIAWFLSVSSQL